MTAERLGATPDSSGVRVAIPAPGAEALWFCLFERGREVARLPLAPGADGVFRATLPGLGAGARYGLRAAGRWAPAEGWRCNPAKLLLDPWARAIEAPLALHASLFDTGAAPCAEDSAPHLPRAIVTAPLPPLDWSPMPPAPLVIYEAHVRGLTLRHPAVPEALRGTFAALAHPAILAHLTRLGVTAVELLPCAAWVEERHLPPLGLT
ncbi:MAG: glycogen debranching enzyme GlgX, partial [Rubritepida sp.]|nr:glycogen debranching enzyme GlgX [Rubritepida sp.]